MMMMYVEMAIAVFQTAFEFSPVFGMIALSAGLITIQEDE